MKCAKISKSSDYSLRNKMLISKILEEDFDYIIENYDFSFLNGKSVFVTGSTGFLGSQICFFLIYLNEKKNANIKIYALARNLEKAKIIFDSDIKKACLSILAGDILDLKKIKCDLDNKKIDLVIHCASITSSKEFVAHCVETIDIAVNGALNILRLSKMKNVKGIVYLSSMEVFGNIQRKESVREKDLGYIDITKPRSSYMESKRLCENLCACFASEFNLNVKIARLTQIVGTGASINDSRVASYFAKSVIDNKNIVLKTSGATKRPILYTRDALSAIFTILKNGKKGECYTAANPDTFFTIRETAQMIAEKIAKNKIKVEFVITNPDEYAPNLNLNLNLNVDKLRSLGWNPSVDLENSYRRMIEDIKGRNK